MLTTRDRPARRARLDEAACARRAGCPWSARTRRARPRAARRTRARAARAVVATVCMSCVRSSARRRILPRLHGLHVGLHRFERAVVPGHEILRRSAACGPAVMSSTSYSTRIWPSVSGPAPMPMTGTRSSRVIAAPSAAGMHSSSTMSAPAFSSAIASRDHLLGRRFLAPLHAKAAGLVHRLRLQSEVRAHRDVVAREELDDLDLAARRFRA